MKEVNVDGRSAAAAILTQAFADSTRGFATVGALRHVASRVDVHSLVEDGALDLTHMMISDSGLQEAFAENTQQVVEALGGIKGLTQKFRDQYVFSYEASIDVASLVLAHSVIDAAVFQFCRASASAAALDWESVVKDKKVSLAELKEGSYEEILKSKVSGIARRASPGWAARLSIQWLLQPDLPELLGSWSRIPRQRLPF